MAFSVNEVVRVACQSRSWFVLYAPGETGVVNKPNTNLCSHGYYLTIIPRARMGFESIAHEAEGLLTQRL